MVRTLQRPFASMRASIALALLALVAPVGQLAAQPVTMPMQPPAATVVAQPPAVAQAGIVTQAPAGEAVVVQQPIIQPAPAQGLFGSGMLGKCALGHTCPLAGPCPLGAACPLAGACPLAKCCPLGAGCPLCRQGKPCCLCNPSGGGWCPACPLPKKHEHKPHEPHYFKVPHPWHQYCDPAGVVIWPQRAIAPIGAEVVMLAGMCNKDSHLRGDENVEWILSPGGVGHFVAVGRRNSLHQLNWLVSSPKKVDNTYAIGTTSSHYLLLTRGTPTTDDDVAVQKGQAWATVSSPVEGTSYVSVYGPSVYGWDRHQRTAEIYWVDAQWQFPPPAVNPVGTRHVFTTVVTRYTSRAPVIGWRVRYEITGGPEAGFAPDGAKILEVPTNDLGQASAEIFQPAPSPGTNQIAIQIIRPADSATGNQRMILGTGTTTKTWSSPDVALKKSGPAQATEGSLATYRIEVTNRGGTLVRDVVVTDQIPSGMSHVSSNPAATIQGNQMEWRLGDVAGGRTVTIELNMRVEQAGTFNNCASMTSAEGLTAQDCVTTTVGASAVDVRMTGPEQAVVGQDVTFQVSVTNRGTTALTGLRVIDRYDGGFQHQIAANPLEHVLPDIAPGATTALAINLRVTQPGQWCNVADVATAAGTLGGARACLTATQGTPAAPGAPSTSGGASGQGSITVEKTGPTSPMNVGDTAEFNISITNSGSTPINDLKVVDNYDVALDPVRATSGYDFEGDNMVWSIPSLAPGRKVQLQVQCKCQQPIDRACNRITVTSREGAGGNGEACVQIRAAAGAAAQPPATASPPSQPIPAAPATPSAAGNLGVTISDLSDPVSAGRTVDYEIRVVNNSTAADQQIAITATASAELTPVASGTSGPAAFDAMGQRIVFQPYAQLAAGETLTYKIRMRAARAGNGQVSVQATSSNMPSGAAAQATTTILSGQ